ncbi:hypothetical protein HMPREF9156_01193 [Scardovia wiggsiae F0424]|uniref:Lipoprotein n=1 Tax=Scardovia wiggsiae F0424 TaxID=857290 RepID=J0DEI2_9BIFI|nr:hypothetical protein [Scardovia wiggsiae]EJD64698.1 hypothetical protein HMPREF9156_01193 [Scardovia wiggsiae F0424]
MKTKKLITVAVAFILACAGLSACGNTGGTSNGASTQSQKAETPKPADLTGKWKETNPASAQQHMEATIEGNTITINWVTSDSTSLYWKGTYEPPTNAGDYSWTSKGDTETMKTALLASRDSTKKFTYTKGQLTYKQTALGVTTTIKMSKQQ